jgi:hypothetical protein
MRTSTIQSDFPTILKDLSVELHDECLAGFHYVFNGTIYRQGAVVEGDDLLRRPGGKWHAWLLYPGLGLGSRLRCHGEQTLWMAESSERRMIESLKEEEVDCLQYSSSYVVFVENTYSLSI